MDPELVFQANDLLEDLAERVAGTSNAERLVQRLLWNVGGLGRGQVLANVINDARVASSTLTEPSPNEGREGHELALWLRKLAEHIAVLVCFSGRDDVRDYWLWIVLVMNVDARKLTAALGTELSVPPTSNELDSFLDRYLSSCAIVKEIIDRYETSGTVGAPWFMKQERWEDILGGSVRAVETWQPYNMRAVMGRTRSTAHSLEVSVMGHYQLAYGHYSSQIHARPPGSAPLWESIEPDALWLSVITIAHRVAELVDHRHADAQRLAARAVESVAGVMRFDGPPEAGEKVRLPEGGEADVIEVARDATVAVVLRQADNRRQVRQTIELLRLTAPQDSLPF